MKTNKKQKEVLVKSKEDHFADNLWEKVGLT